MTKPKKDLATTDQLCMARKLKIDLDKNNLVFGDCEEWLKFIPDESIDLIYIDPPFFSNNNYEVIWGNCYERRSFGDRWKGGIEHYISWMETKIREAHRVLKPTGSIMLHCDWHSSHRLRCLLEEVFGEKNFKNEIVWCYSNSGRPKKFFAKKHDTIFLYTKTDKGYWGDYKIPINKKYLESHYRQKDKDGNICRIRLDAGKMRTYYPSDGMTVNDWWVDIPSLNSQAKERIGYETQKPEALLKRIIQASSNEGDVVLDFFGGGGTTAKVAYDLGRRYITGDVSPVAYRVMLDRLKDGGDDPNQPNPPLTRRQWLNMNDKEFEEKICMFMGWIHNPSSKPVDGWTDQNKTIPVEIKNHQKAIGTQAIKKFLGDLHEHGHKKGVFVAWEFASNAHEYVAKLRGSSEIDITLKPAHEIIGNLVLTDKEMAEYEDIYQRVVNPTDEAS